jgi:hypothetical protein
MLSLAAASAASSADALAVVVELQPMRSIVGNRRWHGMEGASGESGGERRATAVAPARRRGWARWRAGQQREGGWRSRRRCRRTASSARDLGFALTSGGRFRRVQSPAGSIVKAKGKNGRKKFANSLDTASWYMSHR